MLAESDPKRSTRQKRAVEAALLASSTFRSAQELHAELVARGDAVGLSTVYKQLAALASAGAVDVVERDSGEMLYRRCATSHHHHHLVCRSCRDAVELDGPEVERWADAMVRRHGFSEASHKVEIVGTCRRCATVPSEMSSI